MGSYVAKAVWKRTESSKDDIAHRKRGRSSQSLAITFAESSLSYASDTLKERASIIDSFIPSRVLAEL